MAGRNAVQCRSPGTRRSAVQHAWVRGRWRRCKRWLYRSGVNWSLRWCNAYSNPYSDAHTDANTNSYSDGNTYGNTECHAYLRTGRHAWAVGYGRARA